MTDESGDRYEIERIVEKRYRNTRLEYLIKWRGYADSQNTWEPCKYRSTMVFALVHLSSSAASEQHRRRTRGRATRRVRTLQQASAAAEGHG